MNLNWFDMIVYMICFVDGCWKVGFVEVMVKWLFIWLEN